MSRLRAGLISAGIGLAIAVGVFAGFGLPGTLKVAQSDSRYALNAAVDEVVHVGLGPFEPGGPRDITILSVEPQNASPAIQIERIGVSLLDDPEAIVPGTATGVRDDIAALPGPEGIVLRSGDDGVIWVTFRVTATGQHTLAGLRVTYRSGWLTRSTVVGPTTRVRIGEQRGPGDGRERDRSSRRSATRRG